MTRAELAERVREALPQHGLAESKAMVDCVFYTMAEALAQGKRLKVSGFGVFEPRDKRARRGRDPYTGAEITIPAHRVLRWRPSQLLKASMNGGKDGR